MICRWFKKKTAPAFRPKILQGHTLNINLWREDVGLEPIRRTNYLEAVARTRLKEYAAGIGHSSGEFTPYMRILVDLGYKYPAECLAENVADPIKAWIGSPQHRAQVYNRHKKYYGYASDGRHYVLILAG